MAHWAEIDENNIVLRVVVGNNETPDEGFQWIVNNLGGAWVKTSYNSNIRKNYAGKGYLYDEARDAFISPQPFASWVLDEATCLWEAPIAYPAEGDHVWDEEAGNWVEVTDENS